MSAISKDDRIFVAGHRGLVGSALVRSLRAQGYENLLLRTRDEVDLTGARAVSDLFSRERPSVVFLAAAKVGGIVANSTQGAEFIRENLLVQLAVIEAARESHVQKLVFLGSSCIYPRDAPQPIREDYFMTGPLEPTNEPYAMAKISGIAMCRAYNRQYGTDFISVMPTNLYGPGDNFDLTSSHVIPGMIRRLHEAKVNGTPRVEMWGTGNPRREFLHVDDLADACLHIANVHSGDDLVNIGCGNDVSICELASMIAAVVEYDGEIFWDRTQPDGTPRKLLNVDRLRALGWAPKISLQRGIAQTYQWFRGNQGSARLGAS